MLKRLFLNDKFIFGIILLNAILIFLQETGMNFWWINLLDALCTIIFLLEMGVKLHEFGWHPYWRDGWNRMDGTLVILSLPSLVFYLFPSVAFNLSVVLVLRLLRIFRFFRIFHLFPDFEQIVKNVRIAIRQSMSVFIGFGILLFAFALISCAMFKEAAPEYFGTPLESLYSVFRMCTIEGWYDIPNAVAQQAPHWSIHLVRLYFVTILVSMGIIGMSIINSIFVDAMVSDNNNEVLKKLEEIERKLDNRDSAL